MRGNDSTHVRTMSVLQSGLLRIAQTNIENFHRFQMKFFEFALHYIRNDKNMKKSEENCTQRCVRVTATPISHSGVLVVVVMFVGGA